MSVVPTGAALVAFLLASLVLAATPGPGVLYIVARTLSLGRGAGLASVAGVALGNLGNAVAASLGLAALFTLSSTVFAAVKYAGAAYLFYLGIQALRSSTGCEGFASEPARPGQVFRQGFVVALLNPKTTIFFAAFLPQFVHGQASAGLQCLLLSAAFVAMASLTDTTYVFLAALLAPALRSRRSVRRARYAAAATYVGLGIFAALSSRPSTGPRT